MTDRKKGTKKEKERYKVNIKNNNRKKGTPIKNTYREQRKNKDLKTQNTRSR